MLNYSSAGQKYHDAKFPEIKESPSESSYTWQIQFCLMLYGSFSHWSCYGCCFLTQQVGWIHCPSVHPGWPCPSPAPGWSCQCDRSYGSPSWKAAGWPLTPLWPSPDQSWRAPFLSPPDPGKQGTDANFAHTKKRRNNHIKQLMKSQRSWRITN